MPEVNATAPTHNASLSESMTRANNRTFNFNLQDYLYGRKPDFFVYLYNVSEQSFDVYRPPLFANIHIPGRKRGEDFSVAARLPSPLLAPQGSVDSDELTTNLMDTRRVAMDICNPDNLSLDQNAVIAKPTNIGNNLSAKGVFWSLEAPPTKENNFVTSDKLKVEVQDAVKRMETYFNKVLEKMKAMETSDPKGMLEMIGPEAHTAADYFGIETSWHGKRSRPMDCPNCGDRIKAGIAFHRTEEGTLCILDWKRAVASGVRTKQQAIDAGAPGFDVAAPATPVLTKTPAPKSSIPTEDDLDVV
jgi:hypothetical protein